MEHVLEVELELPVSRDRVFAFFSQASNLERITPGELKFQIVTTEPIVMEVGAIIEYRLQLYGMPFGWTTRISTWEPPIAFVDEQLRGPYQEWVHVHTFEETGRGTVIRDRVRYRLPLWPIGEVGAPLIRRQLRRIFAFRQHAVRQALTRATTGPT